MDALDATYNEKRCPDVKGVRDALLQPQNICILLLVAELQASINYFSKFLQTRSLNYSSIKNKLGSVTERLKLIQEGLEDNDAIDSSLVHFHKVVKFLTISAEGIKLARPLCNRVLVNINEIKVKVNNFLYGIGYNFVERLLEEVNKALEEASDVLIDYEMFNPDNDQRKSMLYCKEQFSVLANHYGNEIFDEYNGDTVHANCLISKNDRQAEVQYFMTECNETFEKLKANVLVEANQKLQLNQLKREEMESYIAQH